MWALFLLFLSYLDGALAEGEPSALDEGKSVRGSSLRRAKRGFTYPGTLWCGAGNIADNFEQLGEFAETDKCCRTHDHCPHVIHSFTSKYGFTNFKWHSISHCDCDDTLRKCLRAVNDTASRVVGQAFFNVIEAPCFDFSLEEQCVERYWYGVCKRYDKVAIAVVRESISYDFGGIDVIDVLTLAPPKQKSSDPDKDEQEETKGSESTTQSSFSASQSPAPDDPSFTNVVTAAEDFLKVLATVSTSQSSSADSDKGQTPTSDKKRKKSSGKKKQKDSEQGKTGGKGKGKARKQNAGMVSKANESAAGAPFANTTEGAIDRNKFVKDPSHIEWVSKNIMDGEIYSAINSVHPNKMMRDDYQQRPEERHVGTTHLANANQKVELVKQKKGIKGKKSARQSSTVASEPRNAKLRQSTGRKRQRHPTPLTLHNTMADNTPITSTENSRLAGLTTVARIIPPREVTLHHSESQNEKGLAFTATIQNPPIVGTKKVRSKHRGGRKRSKKLSTPPSPTDALRAEKPSGFTNGATWRPTDVAKRLRPDASETVTERSILSTSGDIRPKRRQQRLKTAGGRRWLRQRNSNSSIMKDKLKPSHDAGTISDYSSSAVSAQTDADSRVNVNSSTELPFPSVTFIRPFEPPLKTRMNKSRKSKVRDKKSRTNKAQI